SMRFDALQKENAELRGLKEALPAVADRWEVAEVINVDLNSLRQRVLLNRGTSNGVFKGQAVMDEKGLLGQTLHVGPWSAEVILITDPEHAVPVQIERNGLRTIAVGAGDTASLALPYLPANADVKTGDLLVTSGLGGVFPAGYPVARVAEVHHDAVQPLAQVRATPLAGIDLDREAVLVWFRPDHPAAPGTAAMTDTKSGNARIQPLPAPPRPATAPGAEAEGATPAKSSASSSKSTAAPKPSPGTKGAAPSAPVHAAGTRTEAPGGARPEAPRSDTSVATRSETPRSAAPPAPATAPSQEPAPPAKPAPAAPEPEQQ